MLAENPQRLLELIDESQRRIGRTLLEVVRDGVLQLRLRRDTSADALTGHAEGALGATLTVSRSRSK